MKQLLKEMGRQLTMLILGTKKMRKPRVYKYTLTLSKSLTPFVIAGELKMTELFPYLVSIEPQGRQSFGSKFKITHSRK